MKKFLIPIGAGVIVFGGVTAFAASLSVNTSSLGAGNATVSSCNASAAVTYNTTPTTSAKTYKVTTAPVTSSAACASMGYQVTLLGASNASLGQVTGSLDTNGAASPDFSSQNIAAQDVVGIAVVITG
ncbi:MAG TPA: hypothetical protein VG650_01400 [Mycobacteriales bacterium]|nr:hypothetical protein [Mycobacteriales bacterium]